MFRLFHLTSPAGLDAPVSVLGDVCAAVFLAKPEFPAPMDDTDPFSPSLVPTACLAFATARDSAVTVSFGHVYLPATPWTREAVRLFADFHVLSTPGRVLALRAVDGGRQAVVVVEPRSEPWCVQFTWLNPQGVLRSTPVYIPGGPTFLDLCSISYQAGVLVALLRSPRLK